MSIAYQHRPIVDWPGEQTDWPRSSPFKAPWPTTLDGLDRELHYLGASNVVIECYMRPDDIRLDGQPRSGARAYRPGIILSFNSDNGPMRFPCDTFDDWKDNVRAIVLTLESFRRIDRYGVTKRGEQYTHWGSLPPPSEVGTASDMSRADAIGFLQEYGGANGNLLNSLDALKEAYRRAALKLHPDRPDGDEKLFVRLGHAKRVIERILNGC